MPHSYEIGSDQSAAISGRAGMEFRSIKIEDDDVLFNDTPKACHAINESGCIIHDKCGIHVHVGFKQITDLSAKYRLFRFVSCYEDLFFAMHSPRPSRAHFCTKLSNPLWESFQRGEGFTYWKDGESSRYWWFNGAAMHRHGTVEFRIMNGTLDPNKILGWVAVLACMFDATVKQSVKLPWRDASGRTPQSLIADIKADTNVMFGDLAKKFIVSHVA